RVPGVDRTFRRADEQGGRCSAGVGRRQVSLAVEALLFGAVARLNLDEADVEARVAVVGKHKRPCDVERADHLVGADVIQDGVAGANLDFISGSWHATALPGRGSRPGAT